MSDITIGTCRPCTGAVIAPGPTLGSTTEKNNANFGRQAMSNHQDPHTKAIDNLRTKLEIWANLHRANSGFRPSPNTSRVPSAWLDVDKAITALRDTAPGVWHGS